MEQVNNTNPVPSFMFKPGIQAHCPQETQEYIYISVVPLRVAYTYCSFPPAELAFGTLACAGMTSSWRHLYLIGGEIDASRLPSGPHSPAAVPCYRESSSRVSRRIRNWDLRQSHRPGKLPGRSHNRCISPCRCHSAWSGGCRHCRADSASMVIACAGQIASHSLQAMQRSSPLGSGAAHARPETRASSRPFSRDSSVDLGLEQ